MIPYINSLYIIITYITLIIRFDYVQRYILEKVKGENNKYWYFLSKYDQMLDVYCLLNFSTDKFKKKINPRKCVAVTD